MKSYEHYRALGSFFLSEGGQTGVYIDPNFFTIGNQDTPTIPWVKYTKPHNQHQEASI